MQRPRTWINRSLTSVLASSVLLAGPVKSEELPYCPSPYPPLGNIAFTLPPKSEASSRVITLADCKLPLPLPEQDPEYVELVNYKDTPHIKKLDLVCVDMASFNNQKPLVQKVNDLLILNPDELAKFLTFARVAAHLDWKADRIKEVTSYLSRNPPNSEVCPSPSNSRNYLAWLEQSEQVYRTAAQAAKPTNIVVEFLDALDKLTFGAAVLSISLGQPEIAAPALAVNRIVGFAGEGADIVTNHFIRYWEMSYENEVKYLSGISTYTNDFFVDSIYRILQEVPQETKKGKITLGAPNLEKIALSPSIELGKTAVLGALDQAEIDKVEAQVAKNMSRFRAIAKVIPAIDSKALQEGLQEGAVSMTPAQLQLYFADRSYYSQINACEIVKEELPAPQGPDQGVQNPLPSYSTYVYPTFLPIFNKPDERFAKKNFLVYCNEFRSNGPIPGPISCDALSIYGKRLFEERKNKGQYTTGCPTDDQLITRAVYTLAKQKYGAVFLVGPSCGDHTIAYFAPIQGSQSHLFAYDLSNHQTREVPNFHTQLFYGGQVSTFSVFALSPNGKKIGSFAAGYPFGGSPQDTYSITSLSGHIAGLVKPTRLVPVPGEKPLNLSYFFKVNPLLIWWPDSSGFFMPTTIRENESSFVYYDGKEVFYCN